MSKFSDNNNTIWDDDGELVPLNPAPDVDYNGDVAAIIVNRNRPDLVESMIEQLKKMGIHLRMDIFVIEMGSNKDKLSKYSTLYYEDKDFRGKCYGHNVGLRLARSRANYRYYWILMNDLVFQEGIDTIGELIKIADANSKVAILSPTEYEGAHLITKPKSGRDYHIVAACDYLSLLIRSKSIDEIGFLNPNFKYSWGAIIELAYKLYSNGWKIAYCDKVTMKHLGGTTYGKAKGTISREEYQRKAREFAARYFVECYGSRWDNEFAKVLPPEIEFKEHFLRARESWESVFDGKKNNLYQFLKNIRKVGNLLSESISISLTSPTDAILYQQIQALNPWYYEVEIGRIRVKPGVGSKETSKILKGRVKFISKLLINEVAKRYDFTGKRLLDIASNCGYWSARYAELGATSLLAVEGRYDYIQQGWLYWNNNNFMKKGYFEFIHGNVIDCEIWNQIRKRGPFDFTLCCGILYHIPNYEELLRNIVSITEEAILIDTRVSESEEFIEEPGGWSFDSIIETRKKKVPNLEHLIQLINELGFQTEYLSTDEPTPIGLKGADDYDMGSRVTLLAVRSE